MRIWIDTTACESTFHVMTSTDDGWQVVHADGSECENIEFQVTEDQDDV